MLGLADEPVEAQPQAAEPQQAAEPRVAEGRLGRELTPLVNYGDQDSPSPRSRSQSLASNPAQAAEPGTGGRVTVADLASEMDTVRSWLRTVLEDLLRAQTANSERAAAAVSLTPAVAFAPADCKDKAQEQPKSYWAAADGAGPSQPQPGDLSDNSVDICKRSRLRDR